MFLHHTHVHVPRSQLYHFLIITDIIYIITGSLYIYIIITGLSHNSSFCRLGLSVCNIIRETAVTFGCFMV